MPVSSLTQNGFEIQLGLFENASQLFSELFGLAEFMRSQFPPLTEVRMVLGMLDRAADFPDLLGQTLERVPGLSLLRTDCRTHIQQSKANLETQLTVVRALRLKTASRLKLSGNVNLKLIDACEPFHVERFGVSLKQAQTIVSELRERSGPEQK
jgi:hypothetical protein